MIGRLPEKWVTCLLLCLLLLAQPASAAARDDPLRHGHALLIGTWAYNDPRWPRLDDVSQQLQQLKAALTANFDDVQVLANLTFDELETGLRHFLRFEGNDSNARLFIYYAGHGYTEIDLRRNEYRGYITASDTPYVDGESGSGFDAARLKAISMEEVRGMVIDVNALQVLFIFDSCFSGTIFAARSASASRGQLTKDDVARLVALPVREFITAGDVQQRIPAHSPLPQLIANALEGDADPYGLGVITGEQLQQYLFAKTRSIGISPREGKLPGGFFDRGEFLFRVAQRPVIPPRAAPRDTTANFPQSIQPSFQNMTAIEWYTDRFGGDYEDFPSESAEACRAQCSREPRCLAFSFGMDVNHCWLKDRITPITKSSTLATGIKIGEDINPLRSLGHTQVVH